MTEQATRSLAEEATLLLDAVSGRLTQARENMAAGSRGEAAPVCPECGRATDSCTACPWCRMSTTLRSQRPEVTLALLDALDAAIVAVRAILPGPNSVPTGNPPAAADAADPAATGSRFPGSGAPQRIPIT